MEKWDYFGNLISIILLNKTNKFSNRKLLIGLFNLHSKIKFLIAFHLENNDYIFKLCPIFY